MVGPKKSQKKGGRISWGPKKAESVLFVNDLNSGGEKIRDDSGVIRLPRWGGPEYHGEVSGTAEKDIVYVPPSIYLHVPCGVVWCSMVWCSVVVHDIGDIGQNEDIVELDVHSLHQCAKV